MKTKLALLALLVIGNANAKSFDFLPENYSKNTYCFAEAAKDKGIEENLLRAISKVETGKFQNGTFVFSPVWLNYGKVKGLSMSDLSEPCIAIHLGAKLLSDLKARYGSEEKYVSAFIGGPPVVQKAFYSQVLRAKKALK